MEENKRNEELQGLQEEASEKRKHARKHFGENEAPIWRWIVGAVVGILFGMIIGSIAGRIALYLPVFADGQFLAPERDLVSGVLSFAGIYFGLWLSIRFFCRTRMRSFYFGSGRKADIRSMLTVGGLYFLGMVIATLLSIRNISYAYYPVSLILANLLFCLLLVWIQTSTEEIIFRGFFLRIPYKNETPMLPRGLIAAILSSLLFMGAHLYNPEVTTQSGLSIAIAASNYFITAMGMFLSNLVIGGMEGGLIIHFVNNFFCFFVLQAEVSALPTPALFIDHTKRGTAYIQLASLLITYVPPAIYLIRKYKKQKVEKLIETIQENREDLT